jgi:amino acid transporter
VTGKAGSTAGELQSATAAGHGLRRELGLRDLVPMQILLVVGVTWAGTAARQGGTHWWYWLAAILTMFVPLAAVVGWCATVWPYEGGVYQWTKFALGPFAGFLSAWNFAMWALLAVSNLGILTATSLAYGLGPGWAWIENSHLVILGLTLGLFALILVVNLPGFGIGRWVSHFGTAVTVLVTLLLLALLFVHPGATAAHPHISPQPPFALALPVFTLLSVNLFSKIAFNALSGLEQVAVFAGETRDPGRTIMRSAWLAAPIIAVIYLLMTGSMLEYTPAGQIDLTGPIPQVLAVAFGSGAGSGAGIDWGLLLGRGAILVLAVALVAQFAVIVAETSRLPMVAGWDRIVPEWCTRLHPRWKTPVWSIVLIVVAAVVFAIAAIYGTGAQEAFQVVNSSGNIFYGIYYLMLFAIPLIPRVGAQAGRRPGLWLKAAAVSGFVVTAVSMVFNLLPIVDVSSTWAFALKVVLASALLNAVGVVIYLRGTRGRANRAGIKVTS